MLCACSSPSDLSLCSASQSLSISKSQSSNSAQILKSTEISWNIFGSSGPSLKVPDFLRKFRKFPGSSGLLRKFRTLNFSTKFLVTLSFLPLPKLPLLPSRTPYLSLSLSQNALPLPHKSLSLSTNPPPPQISGSSPNLRNFRSKCLQVDHLCLHCIPLGHLLKESRYCLMLPYWNFFPISLIRSNYLNPFGKDVNMFIMDVYSSFEGMLMVKTRVLRILRNLGLGFISNLVLDQIFRFLVFQSSPDF